MMCLCCQDGDGGCDIINTEADMGILGRIQGGLNLYIYKGIAKLSQYLWYESQGGGESLDEVDFQIYYCPICGKKLDRR